MVLSVEHTSLIYSTRALGILLRCIGVASCTFQHGREKIYAASFWKASSLWRLKVPSTSHIFIHRVLAWEAGILTLSNLCSASSAAVACASSVFFCRFPQRLKQLQHAAMGCKQIDSTNAPAEEGYSSSSLAFANFSRRSRLTLF